MPYRAVISNIDIFLSAHRIYFDRRGIPLQRSIFLILRLGHQGDSFGIISALCIDDRKIAALKL